jgi:KDO2-lipid IV(A) lauroyltransferase
VETLILGFTRVFSWLPLWLTHAIAAGIGRLAFRFRRARCVIEANLRLCFPELSDAERDALARENLIETVKTFAELGAMWRWPAAKTLGLIRRIEGKEAVDAVAGQHPLIFLTPHLGSWELAGLYASFQQPVILYRPSRKYPRLDAFIRYARERGGARLIAADRRGLRTVHECLKHNGVVGILPDHEPTSVGAGVFAPFFGVAAFTAPLIPRLARSYGAKVFFGYCERLPGGQGFIGHYIPAPAEIYSEDMDIAAAALNRGIEDCVRRCPAQYLWNYRRFRSRPPGEPALYEECRHAR